MDDLDFLLLASHLFETRDGASCRDDPMGINDIATWLRNNHKLRLYRDTDPEEDVIIPLEDPRIMDLVNVYNPLVNVMFTIESESDALMIKRLRLQSSRRVTYNMKNANTLRIPVLHGGQVIVEGDVDGRYLTGLVQISPAKTVMTTSIRVEGSLTDFDEGVSRSLIERLINIIYNTEDADMLGFSLEFEGGSDPGTSPPSSRTNIRGWVVESTTTSISALNRS